MRLAEKIVGDRIDICRPELSINTAEKVYNIVDRNRNHFLPWLGWVDFTKKVEDSFSFLEKVDLDWNSNKEFVYAICIKDTVEIIGLISVINISSDDNRAEIGYWLDIDYVGKGYMKEALSMIEKELWSKGFNRIVIHTDILNEKSANVARSMGYFFEGVLRQNIFSKYTQNYRDINVFSKLKSDIKL